MYLSVCRSIICLSGHQENYRGFIIIIIFILVIIVLVIVVRTNQYRLISS